MRRPDRKKSKNLKVLREIWRFLMPYKKMLLAAGFFLIFTSSITLGLGQGIRITIDKGFIAGSENHLAWAILGFVLLGLALAVGTYFRHYFVSWLGEKVTTDIRSRVYRHTVYLHPAFFELNSASEIQSRLTADITLLQALIGSSFSMALRNSLTFIGGVIFLFLTNVKLSLVVIASVPFIMGPILIFGKKLRVLTRDRQKALAKIGVLVNESLFNIKTVQAYNHQQVDEKRFESVSDDFLRVSRGRILYRSFFFAISIFFTLASVAAMLYLGGRDVMAGQLSAGDLAAFIFYAFMVASSVAAISEVYGDLQLAAGATERLMQLYTTEPEIASPEKPVALPEKVAGNLKLNKVVFSYANNDHSDFVKSDVHPPELKPLNVLKNITLELQAGKTYALVGPSGAGKSTIFDLIMRYYDMQSGAITLDGIDIRKLDLAGYRNLIATVPQAPVIFSGTVADNIRYSKEGADEKEIIAAAKLSYSHEFIQKMPRGYESFLGENGERLSGGQKQRIAIARAFLKDPRILLLDEATNSLDAESEFRVQKALDKLRLNRTTLIIAHRIATVANADEIFVIHEGKVIEKGKHKDLYKKSKLYRRFCDLQLNNSIT